MFISHAGEDKDAIARPLAEELRGRGLEVWYDEFELRVGQSLLLGINEGLVGSRRAVVILSPSFFAKHWPKEELAGLSALEAASGERRVIPVWHDLTQLQVAQVAPMLADRFAATTADPISVVAVKIIEALEDSAMDERLPVVALSVEIVDTTDDEVRLRVSNPSAVHAANLTFEPRELTGRGMPMIADGSRTVLAGASETITMRRFPPERAAADADWDMLYTDPAEKVLKRQRLHFRLYPDVARMTEYSSLFMTRPAAEQTYTADELKPWPTHATDVIQAFLFAQEGLLLTGTTRYLRALRTLDGTEPDPQASSRDD